LLCILKFVLVFIYWAHTPSDDEMMEKNLILWKLSFIWMKTLNEIACNLNRIWMQFNFNLIGLKFPNWIELNKIFFSYGWNLVNVLIEFQLNSIEIPKLNWIEHNILFIWVCIKVALYCLELWYKSHWIFNNFVIKN